MWPGGGHPRNGGLPDDAPRWGRAAAEAERETDVPVLTRDQLRSAGVARSIGYGAPTAVAVPAAG